MFHRASSPAFLAGCGLLCLAVAASGCRSHQHARVIQPGEREMVGSHQAGSETFEPLIEGAVGSLLARHCGVPATMAAYGGAPVMPHPKRICFIGVENKSSEEIGDFKEQIYQCIDTQILQAGVFQPISRRFVEAGLRTTRLRPDELFVPSNMQTFSMYMEQQGQPFDYLLYATLTSGTTRQNKDYQRDYVLTLEMVDLRSGQYDKQSAEISKGYHHSAVSRWTAKHWFN